ncbi:YigZ family protein [Seongchinamella unica]|uniref:YigZ family protein n=1 Tax=Seongchinamella unica TaxID=2547392 RepID=A0A4R5LTY3_9GAMM|nr:YigZ family protein [Seongchinamella unica]
MKVNLLIPARECEAELVVKKSRFIARLVPVQDRGQVNAAVARARLDYPDARHHCWAYLLGRPADATGAGMSDDGEPAGTAGKPILNVLQHGELGNVLVIVVRYFGGIKLGAAGLVRAYANATRQVLDITPAQRLTHWHCYLLCGDFSLEQPLRHLLSGLQGKLSQIDYGVGIEVQLQLAADDVIPVRNFCAAHGAELKAVD